MLCWLVFLPPPKTTYWMEEKKSHLLTFLRRIQYVSASSTLDDCAKPCRKAYDSCLFLGAWFGQICWGGQLTTLPSFLSGPPCLPTWYSACRAWQEIDCLLPPMLCGWRRCQVNSSLWTIISKPLLSGLFLSLF